MHVPGPLPPPPPPPPPYPLNKSILLPLIGDCHRCVMTDECENIKPLIMVTFKGYIKRYMEGERLGVQRDVES
jgi:hypothetical protein